MEMDKPTPPEDVARLRAAIERAAPPAALGSRVGRQIARAREKRARRRRMSVGGFALAGGLALTVAALALPAGTQPSIEQAVRVAAAASLAPAPAVDSAAPRRLTAHVDDVWFPSWHALRWRAVARSSETVAGSPALTVYYARGDGVRVAYTIVGRTLPWPDHSRAVTYNWTKLYVYADSRQRVITWRARGHQCVIAAPRSLPASTLLALGAAEA
jgi:hypothetical protein